MMVLGPGEIPIMAMLPETFLCRRHIEFATMNRAAAAAMLGSTGISRVGGGVGITSFVGVDDVIAESLVVRRWRRGGALSS